MKEDFSLVELLKGKIEIIVAIVIFVVILFGKFDFYKAIVLMLEFIVVLEVTKMVSEFIKNERIRLRYVLDVFMIFLIRDVVIQITHLDKKYEDILFLLFVIMVFFLFRILAIKYSPSSVYKIDRRANSKDS